MTDQEKFEKAAQRIHELLEELERGYPLTGDEPEDDQVLDIVHRAKWLLHDLAFPA